MMQRVLGLLRWLVVPCVLLFSQHHAHADLWAYVDDQGVTHFATERVDGRYQLFLRIFEAEPHGDAAADALPRPAAQSDAGARLKVFFDTAAHYKNVRHHLRAAAAAHGVDYELLKALIVTESGFDAQALSPKGAVGLMQVMPATARRFGVSGDVRRTVAQKLADPAVNVSTGTRYLRYLLDLFPGRLDLALAAYNAGEGAVQRAGNQIPAFKETRDYVRTVLSRYTQLKPPAAGSAEDGMPGRVRVQLQGGAASRGNLPPTHGAQTPPAPQNLTEPVPHE
jgi:soluble lytic murein transglycosylase-like protein